MRYLTLLLLVFISCTRCEGPLTSEKIIADAVKSYGLSSLNSKTIEFDFRNRRYTLERGNQGYTYTRSFQDSLGFVKDVLVNSTDFSRYINGVEVTVDSVWQEKYSNSVNSVLYFVQLPLTLLDPAAMKKYLGVTSVKDSDYHLIEVRFQEEGGGKDFEDVFLYWFNVEDLSMDYLAYSYITDGGGVRFREAINRREIEGITFQDYINFKPASKETSLDQLASLFEQGELLELSRIENENILIK